MSAQGDAQADLADIRDSQQGESAAFARIIRRHQQTLARRMLRFSRDPRVVEELVHDTFVEAYFSLARYRGDAPFLHWLMRIATRVGYRHWTRKKKDRLLTFKLSSLAPESDARDAEKNEAAEVLEKVLDQLSPRDRLVITLLYLEERSVAEAADLAGWSQVMVKVQAFRARGKLKKLLENEPHGVNDEIRGSRSTENKDE